MPRVLFHVTHHPRPEHRDDLLGAMTKVNAAAEGVPGLEAIGAFSDAAAGRVVAISLWSSPEAMQSGLQRLFAGVGEIPFDRWEERPSEALVLPETAVPSAAER